MAKAAAPRRRGKRLSVRIIDQLAGAATAGNSRAAAGSAAFGQLGKMDDGIGRRADRLHFVFLIDLLS
jgi:hypothetical protein